MNTLTHTELIRMSLEVGCVLLLFAVVLYFLLKRKTLNITQATYGTDIASVDVTEHVKRWLGRGKTFYVPANTNLPNLFQIPDPAIGTMKKLSISYKIGKVEGLKEFQDGEEIKINP